MPNSGSRDAEGPRQVSSDDVMDALEQILAQCADALLDAATPEAA